MQEPRTQIVQVRGTYIYIGRHTLTAEEIPDSASTLESGLFAKDNDWSTSRRKMDLQTWSEEAIRHGSRIHEYYSLAALLLTAFTPSSVLVGLVVLFYATSRRVWIILLPLLATSSSLFWPLLAEVVAYRGVLIKIVGIGLDIEPVLPWSCQLMAPVEGRGSSPCLVDRYREAATMLLHHEQWAKLAGTREYFNMASLGVIFVLLIMGGLFLSYCHWQCGRCARMFQWRGRDYKEDAEALKRFGCCAKCLKSTADDMYTGDGDNKTIAMLKEDLV